MANRDLTPADRERLEQLKAESLRAILEMEITMSPENITCDGERGRFNSERIQRQVRAIEKVKATEVKNFGKIVKDLEGAVREPTLDEIWMA